MYTKYVYGNGLIGEETNGQFKTYHFDYRGSTIAITDSQGNVTDRFKYNTYGKVTEHTGNSDVIFKYNGRDGVITEPNGLYYMRARYYSPDLMRFINADILSGSISDTLTLNRYAYANCNPVSNIDPFGLEASRGTLGPTPLEAAYMADHIYNGNIKEEIEGWTLDDILVDENGFRIGIYKRIAPNGTIEYTIVNKGSSTIDDWLDNFKQPFGLSKDMKRSISIAKDFVNEHKDAHITFVGHSKGGAEALANAKATNRDAIVFNPAIPNYSFYGLGGSEYTATATSYVVTGEVLSSAYILAESIAVGSYYSPISHFDDFIRKVTRPIFNSKPFWKTEWLKNDNWAPVEDHKMASVKDAL